MLLIVSTMLYSRSRELIHLASLKLSPVYALKFYATLPPSNRRSTEKCLLSVLENFIINCNLDSVLSLNVQSLQSPLVMEDLDPADMKPPCPCQRKPRYAGQTLTYSLNCL